MVCMRGCSDDGQCEGAWCSAFELTLGALACRLEQAAKAEQKKKEEERKKAGEDAKAERERWEAAQKVWKMAMGMGLWGMGMLMHLVVAIVGVSYPRYPDPSSDRTPCLTGCGRATEDRGHEPAGG